MRRRLALYALLLAPTVTALHRGDAATGLCRRKLRRLVRSRFRVRRRARRASCSGSTPRPVAPAAEREKARTSSALRPQFEAAGLEGRRLFVDPPATTRKFAEEHNFGYPLISNGAVIRQTGACRREDRCTGKRTTRSIRRTARCRTSSTPSRKRRGGPRRTTCHSSAARLRAAARARARRST